jgi:protoheme IX farnesyltransferase
MTHVSPVCNAPQATAALGTAAVPFGSGYLSRWSDFGQLTKPRMNVLVVATTLVGYYIGSRGHVDWLVLLDTLIGTTLTAAAASVLNQYAEGEYDALMKRTRNRPLPAGRVHPLEALYFGIAMAIVGMFYLVTFVNVLTAALGGATLLAYVLIYTPLKRSSTLNTVVGAVPGAIPPVMGFTAAQHSLSPEALAVFAILFLWQMPHFLAIAVLYRDDYAAAGFRMLPVVDRELRVTGEQIVLYTLTLILASLVPVYLGMSGVAYLAAALLLGVGFLGFGVACAAQKTRLSARRLFFASILYLPVLLGAMVADVKG